MLGFVGSNVTTYTHSGLSPGQTYCYRVHSYNGSGQSDYSNPACAIAGTPIAPINLTISTTNSSTALLSWQDMSNNESGYGIDIQQDNMNWQVLDFVGSNVTTYQHTGLTQGHSYCFRVYGYNNFGLSNYSNEACIQLTLPTGIKSDLWMFYP